LLLLFLVDSFFECDTIEAVAIHKDNKDKKRKRVEEKQNSWKKKKTNPNC